ncbi:hypothetical protein MIR68_004704 [Amoeboaphelidium protococcarum]|nr:hypothetical protein MIR68_004704 [Amoeboaphelidium protococcarum]
MSRYFRQAPSAHASLNFPTEVFQTWYSGGQVLIYEIFKYGRYSRNVAYSHMFNHLHYCLLNNQLEDARRIFLELILHPPRTITEHMIKIGLQLVMQAGMRDASHYALNDSLNDDDDNDDNNQHAIEFSEESQNAVLRYLQWLSTLSLRLFPRVSPAHVLHDHFILERVFYLLFFHMDKEAYDYMDQCLHTSRCASIPLHNTYGGMIAYSLSRGDVDNAYFHKAKQLLEKSINELGFYDCATVCCYMDLLLAEKDYKALCGFITTLQSKSEESMSYSSLKSSVVKWTYVEIYKIIMLILNRMEDNAQQEDNSYEMVAISNDDTQNIDLDLSLDEAKALYVGAMVESIKSDPQGIDWMDQLQPFVNDFVDTEHRSDVLVCLLHYVDCLPLVWQLSPADLQIRSLSQRLEAQYQVWSTLFFSYFQQAGEDYIQFVEEIEQRLRWWTRKFFRLTLLDEAEHLQRLMTKLSEGSSSAATTDPGVVVGNNLGDDDLMDQSEHIERALHHLVNITLVKCGIHQQLQLAFPDQVKKYQPLPSELEYIENDEQKSMQSMLVQNLTSEATRELCTMLDVDMNLYIS